MTNDLYFLIFREMAWITSYKLLKYAKCENGERSRVTETGLSAERLFLQLTLRSLIPSDFSYRITVTLRFPVYLLTGIFGSNTAISSTYLCLCLFIQYHKSFFDKFDNYIMFLLPALPGTHTIRWNAAKRRNENSEKSHFVPGVYESAISLTVTMKVPPTHRPCHRPYPPNARQLLTQYSNMFVVIM